jgi:alkylation response protein AidB-like acyl-CoA dehydrogenase
MFAWRAARTAPPCLRATANVFDALGASGVSEELLLDRHWRNARILASHNPRVYKARILGDWLINGKDPLPNIAKLGRGGQGN